MRRFDIPWVEEEEDSPHGAYVAAEEALAEVADLETQLAAVTAQRDALLDALDHILVETMKARKGPTPATTTMETRKNEN